MPGILDVLESGLLADFLGDSLAPESLKSARKPTISSQKKPFMPQQQIARMNHVGSLNWVVIYVIYPLESVNSL